MRKLLLALVLLLAPSLLHAQSTTITGNVTDLNGQAWTKGFVSATFVPVAGTPSNYVWTGGAFNPNQGFVAQIDGSGNYSISLPSNTAISPANSRWQLVANSGTTADTTGQVVLIVSGTSETVNIVPPPIKVDAGTTHPVTAYTNAEVKAQYGQFYYRVTDGHIYVCTTSTTDNCTVWVPLCEPGDGLCGGGSSNVSIQHNGTLVGTQPIVNLIDGSNITLTVTNDNPDTRVNVTIAAAGGGGCTLPGIDKVVLFEHPIGTCDGTTHFTWDVVNSNLQISDSSANTVGTSDTFLIGPGNSLAGNTFSFIVGNGNDAATGSFQNHVYMLGTAMTTENLTVNNDVTINIGTNDIGKAANVGSGGKNNVSIGFNEIFNATFTTSLGVNDIGVAGATGVEQNGIVLGGNQEGNCVAGVSAACGGTGAGRGSSNGFAILGDTNLVNQNGTGTANSIYLFGFDNRADTTIGNITGGGAYEFGLDNEIDGSVGNDVVIGGASNTAHNNQVASCLGASDSSIWGDLNVVTGSSNFQIFGGQNTVTSLNCVAVFGNNITATAANTAYFGMSTVAGLTISTASNHDNVRRTPVAFGLLPACAAGTEGSFAAITDSSTNTWGATITGGSTNHVLGYCDGTNWTVAGK